MHQSFESVSIVIFTTFYIRPGENVRLLESILQGKDNARVVRGGCPAEPNHPGWGNENETMLTIIFRQFIVRPEWSFSNL